MDRLRRRRLLRPVITNVIVNNLAADLAAVNLSASTVASSANDRYVRRIPNYMFTMDLLAYMLLLLLIMFNTSSVLVFHMLVATVVMSNILELIMKLLPNYPTINTQYI